MRHKLDLIINTWLYFPPRKKRGFVCASPWWRRILIKRTYSCWPPQLHLIWLCWLLFLLTWKANLTCVPWSKVTFAIKKHISSVQWEISDGSGPLGYDRTLVDWWMPTRSQGWRERASSPHFFWERKPPLLWEERLLYFLLWHQNLRAVVVIFVNFSTEKPKLFDCSFVSA